MGFHHPKTGNSLLIFLPARQFNEEEYLVISKMLKNSGFSIFITSDTSWVCEGNNGLKVKPDINILNINENNFAGLILTGGTGTRNYFGNIQLHKAIKKFNDKKKIVAAICSAPVILAKADILAGVTATCFYEDRMELINAGAEYKDSPVIVRKNIITANNAKFAAELTNAVIEILNCEKDNLIQK